jgi:hypothetical protein
MTYRGPRLGSDGNGRGRGGCGRAWFGEASWRCGVWTGLRVVCGHRLGTRRRETLDCLSETKTKVFDAVSASDAAQTLWQCVASARRERICVENFIGLVVSLGAGARSYAARRLWRGARHARCLSALIHGFVRAARAVCRICGNCGGFGGQVPLDQPSRQQGTAAFVHPRIEQVPDFLPHVGGEIQPRLFKRLQSRLRRTEKKFPIHFLLGMLAHGDPP